MKHFIRVAIALFAATTIQNSSFAQDAIFVKPDGSVGIGRSDPSFPLDVQGVIRATGNIKTDKDLDVTGNIKVSGTHLVYSSGNAVIDFGEEKAGYLFFRSLQKEKGDFTSAGSYKDIMNLDANGNLTILGNIKTVSDLEVHNGNITVGRGMVMNSGVIQRAGLPITQTKDLGLYSTVKNDWVRLVSNKGKIVFFTKDETLYGNDGNISMVVDNTGFVGIGAGSEPELPLTVKITRGGSGGKYNNSWGYQIGWPGGQKAEDSRHYGNCGIYSTGDIVTNNILVSTNNNNYSDIRIKKDISLTSSSEDLETLKKIEIVNYRMIDTIAWKGMYKKVIAQQVQQVYPLAITPYSYYLPSIFQPATKVEQLEGNNYTITVSTAHHLSPGDLVKFMCYPGVEEIIATVKEVTGPAAFTATSNTPIAKGTSVFVYGKEVDDMLTVDYDALAMLNISATQELAKTIEAQQKRIAQLEHLQTENADIKNLLAALENRMKALEVKNDVKPSMALK